MVRVPFLRSAKSSVEGMKAHSAEQLPRQHLIKALHIDEAFKLIVQQLHFDR
jgi:hypothetical protein